MSLWDTVSGYGSSLGQDFMGGFGNLSPGYPDMTPAQKQAVAYGNIANWGAGVLGGGNRGAGNLGTGLKYAQNSALRKNRGEIASAMFKEQQTDAKEKRKRMEQNNAAWKNQFGPIMERTFGLPQESLSNMDYQSGFQFSKMLSSGGQKATSAMKNFAHYQKLLKEQGPDAANRFWNAAESGQDINVNTGNQSTLETELVENLGKKMGVAWSGISDQGRKAAGMAREMELLGELIEVAPTGPITGRLAEAFPGFSDSATAIESIVKRLAPQQRAEGSGSTSDIEYAGMLKSMPALRNNPAANRLIVGAINRKAEIDKQMAQVVDAYTMKRMTFEQAQQKLGELNNMSMMTPELQALIRGVTPQSGGGAGEWTVEERP